MLYAYWDEKDTTHSDFLKSYIFINIVVALDNIFILFYFPQGGAGVTCPPLCALVAPYFAIFGRGLPSLRILVPVSDVCAGVVEGLGGVEALIGIGLPQYAYLNRFSPATSSHCGIWVLILCAGTLEPPDAPMCGPYQSDGNTTLDVSAHPLIGLPPLCCKAAGYPLHGERRLHTQQSIDEGNKGGEVYTLLEACLQVHLLLFSLCLL